MNDMPDRELDPPENGWYNECVKCGEEFWTDDLCVPWCPDCTPLSINHPMRRDALSDVLIEITRSLKK